MAEAYATFAARGMHCDSRPVTAIEDADGNAAQEYPTQCKQVMPKRTADAVNDILRGVMEPGGFGASGISLDAAVRRQDRHHQRQQVGLVRRLHAQPRDRGDDRRRQQRGRPDHPRRPDHRRPVRRQRLRLRRSPARSGATRCRRSSSGCPTTDFVAPDPSGIRACIVTVPSHRRHESPSATRPARGGRLHRRSSAGTVNSELRRRHGRLHRPRAAARYAAAARRHDLHLRRHARRRRAATAAGGNGGGTAAATAAATAVAALGADGDDAQAPSWRRTSAATAPPSARPLTWG